MASFTSNPVFATDIRTTNLYWYQAYGYDANVLIGANKVFRGVTYPDVAYADGSNGSQNLELVLGGHGFTTDLSGKPTGGTVTGILQADLNAQSVQWAAEGISMSFTAIYAASFTPSNADELSLFAKAFAGADTIKLSNLVDYFRGYAGNDTMYGYDGNDTLIGDAGSDTIYGGTGNDKLQGGVGNDTLYGEAGSDVLTGGAGSDRLYGGADTVRDVFDFNLVTESTSASRDLIYDFKSGTDRIDLAGIDAHAGTATNDAFAGFTGTTPTAYSVWYAKADVDQDGSIDDLLLRADVNGDKIVDFEAGIINTSAITKVDLIL